MRKNKPTGRHGQTNNFWQSYSDMMAALLLVFVLVLTGTVLQAQQDYERKQAELDEAIKTIEEQSSVLKNLLGIRQEIVLALKKQFTDDQLTVDPQTGAIIFDSELLFGFGDYRLTNNGKVFLREFMPKYINILLGEEFAPYVAEIIIEGHTDTVSDYFYNLELSQDRAFTVATFILSQDQPLFPKAQREQLRKIVTANGRSWSDPIYKSDGKTVDMTASRRVEIQFRLKDEEMIKQMLDAISSTSQTE